MPGRASILLRALENSRSSLAVLQNKGPRGAAKWKLAGKSLLLRSLTRMSVIGISDARPIPLLPRKNSATVFSSDQNRTPGVAGGTLLCDFHRLLGFNLLHEITNFEMWFQRSGASTGGNAGRSIAADRDPFPRESLPEKIRADSLPAATPSTSSGQALRKVRGGWGAHRVVSEIKSLGHASCRPSCR